MLLTVLFQYLGVDLEDEFCKAINKKRIIDEVFVRKTKVFRKPREKGKRKKVLLRIFLLGQVNVKKKMRVMKNKKLSAEGDNSENKEDDILESGEEKSEGDEKSDR